MANNRMYLLHRPSGKAVYLARFPAGGEHWDVASPDTLAPVMQELFESLGSADDWCLAMEDCNGAPLAFGDWGYTAERGVVRTLEITSPPAASPEYPPPS